MRLTRRDILILVFVWILVVGVFVAAILILRNMSAGSQPQPVQPSPVVEATPTLELVYTPVASQQTARSLYPLAEEAARAWQPDAEFLSCRGSWETTAINLVGEPIEWNYRFYSDQMSALYFVTVKPDGQVQGIQHLRRLDRKPPALALDAWQVDSPVALTNWLNAGGGEFLGGRPGIEVSAQLEVRSQDSVPEWIVVGYDRSDGAYLAVTVEAETGQTTVK